MALNVFECFKNHSPTMDMMTGINKKKALI